MSSTVKESVEPVKAENPTLDSMKMLAGISFLAGPVGYVAHTYNTDDAFAQELELKFPGLFVAWGSIFGSGVACPVFDTSAISSMDISLRAELGRIFLELDLQQADGFTAAEAARVLDELGYSTDATGAGSLAARIDDARAEVRAVRDARRKERVGALSSAEEIAEAEAEAAAVEEEDAAQAAAGQLNVDEFWVLVRAVSAGQGESDEDVRRRVRASQRLSAMLPSAAEVEREAHARAYAKAQARQNATWGNDARRAVAPAPGPSAAVGPAAPAAQGEREADWSEAGGAAALAAEVSAGISDLEVADVELARHELATTRGHLRALRARLAGRDEEEWSAQERGRLARLEEQETELLEEIG
jgi:hypothetical protein